MLVPSPAPPTSSSYALLGPNIMSHFRIFFSSSSTAFCINHSFPPCFCGGAATDLTMDSLTRTLVQFLSPLPTSRHPVCRSLL